MKKWRCNRYGHKYNSQLLCMKKIFPVLFRRQGDMMTHCFGTGHASTLCRKYTGTLCTLGALSVPILWI